MGKWKWVLVIVLAFSLALNCAFVGVWAYHFVHVRPLLRARLQGPPPLMGWHPALTKERLDALRLTPQQRRNVFADTQALRRALEPIRLRAKERRERYLALLADPESDNQAILNAQRQLERDLDEMRRLVFDYMLNFRGRLSKEQLRELSRFIEAREEQPRPPREPERTWPAPGSEQVRPPRLPGPAPWEPRERPEEMR